MKASQAEHEHQIANLNSRIDRLETEKASLAVEVQNARQQQNNKPDQVTALRGYLLGVFAFVFFLQSTDNVHYITLEKLLSAYVLGLFYLNGSI